MAGLAALAVVPVSPIPNPKLPGNMHMCDFRDYIAELLPTGPVPASEIIRHLKIQEEHLRRQMDKLYWKHEGQAGSDTYVTSYKPFRMVEYS